MRQLVFLLVAALPLGAAAQYDGPAVPACRTYAERELKKQLGDDMRAVRFDNDRHLLLVREARKLGSQPVSATLSGHGAIVRRAGPPFELSFVCLLAGEKRALWFHWMPRQDAPALRQCQRGGDAQECLQLLHDLAERDLVEASAMRFQESLQADASVGNNAASTAYRNSAAAWRAYRDAECARRGPGGSDAWRACMADLTRLRYFDLQ
ncbi:MAG: DUF1311 domain-containing protein [Betaproteobacteria bacterium]|nr:DUF1311 domain-containing protein [Betaproteobacteria bacterium]MDH5220509.1 DUF1311 domain-containing protein [Betaproteobacteria bacterium]MDH5351373.1 DUF1311 domain-containing protein [Betaproteobacteria bacterium]